MKASRRRKKDQRPAPGAAPGSFVIPLNAPKPVIRLMDYTPTTLEEKFLKTPAEAAPYLADDRPSITWVDVQGLGERQVLEELKRVFDIHQLALADVVNIPQRPKVESYDRYLFVITRMTLPTQSGELSSEQISIFIGRSFVLTFQETYGDCLDPVRERIRTGKGAVRKSGADYLSYAIIDAIVDQYFPVVESLGERIEQLEDEVVAEPGPETLRKIYALKRTLLEVRRGIWPQREAINSLLHDDSGIIDRSVHVYLRDCYDHAVQCIEVVESLRELTAMLLDVYLSSISNRTNDIMRLLTVISAIFIPLTFIAGVYGMNFKTEASPFNMPELAWEYGYLATIGLMLAVALLLLLFFWRKGWLHSMVTRPSSRQVAPAQGGGAGNGSVAVGRPAPGARAPGSGA